MASVVQRPRLHRNRIWQNGTQPLLPRHRPARPVAPRQRRRHRQHRQRGRHDTGFPQNASHPPNPASPRPRPDPNRPHEIFQPPKPNTLAIGLKLVRPTSSKHNQPLKHLINAIHVKLTPKEWHKISGHLKTLQVAYLNKRQKSAILLVTIQRLKRYTIYTKNNILIHNGICFLLFESESIF